jgi:phospholipase/carboxylesterase
VPALRGSGYDVTYEEFDGGHTVPPPVADRAFAWWLARDRA